MFKAIYSRRSLCPLTLRHNQEHTAMLRSEWYSQTRQTRTINRKCESRIHQSQECVDYRDHIKTTFRTDSLSKPVGGSDVAFSVQLWEIQISHSPKWTASGTDDILCKFQVSHLSSDCKQYELLFSTESCVFAYRILTLCIYYSSQNIKVLGIGINNSWYSSFDFNYREMHMKIKLDFVWESKRLRISDRNLKN